MKKLITGILATTLALSCFVGCGETENPPAGNPLAEATSLLEEMYKKKDLEVRDDYEVLSQIMYEDVTYAITWTTNVPTVQIVERNGKIYVDVDPEATEDVAYTLTATLTDAEGKTETVSFDRVVKKAPSKVKAPISSTPTEDTVYKLYMYHTGNKQDLYFAGSMKGYYGATTQEFEEGADIYVEYAEGSTTEFYLYFNYVENAEDTTPEKRYISVVVSGTHINFTIDQTTALTKFVYSEDLKAIVTVDSYEKSDKNTTEQCFLGTYGTNVTFGPSQLNNAPTSYIGTLVTMMDRDKVTDEFKVSEEKKMLVPVEAAYAGTATVTLPTEGTNFSDVKITYAVAGEGAVLEGNTLTFTAGTATTDVTLTATLKAGDKTATAEYTVKVVPNDPAAILAAGKAIAQDAKFGNEVTLTGIVTSIDTVYSEQYGNVTVTIKVGDTSIQCFRLVGTQAVLANVIAVSDEITVTGIIANYKGNAQFGAGCKAIARVEGDGTLPDDGNDDVQEGALIASLNMMGTTNLTSRTTTKTIYTANGITYQNDKASSTTDNYDQKGTYAARAYQGSTITITATTAFKKVQFTLDDYDNGKYLPGFDGMTIAGATITRENDVVTITFTTAVTTFTTANLIKQARIEKIEIFA
jgi:hypothetical protein